MIRPNRGSLDDRFSRCAALGARRARFPLYERCREVQNVDTSLVALLVAGVPGRGVLET